MSTTPAGWYDDPTAGGRLRYWDGGQWTEWVSSNGETTSAPLTPPAPAVQREVAPAPTRIDVQPAVAADPTAARIAPASDPTAGRIASSRQPVTPEVIPTPGIAPAPAPVTVAGAGATLPPVVPSPAEVSPATPGRPSAHPADRLGRIGHIITAVGGLVPLLATGRDLSFQSTGVGTITFKATAAVPVTGLVLTAAAVLALLVPSIWARLAGHTVAAGALVFLLAIMLGTRTSDQFLPGIDVEVRGGWWILLVAALLGAAGLILATARFVVPGRGDDGRTTAPPFAVLGFVLSLVGILVPPLAAGGAAAALCGRHDFDRSSGRIGSRGLAVAGFVVGLVVFCLWTAGLLLAALVAQP